MAYPRQLHVCLCRVPPSVNSLQEAAEIKLANYRVARRRRTVVDVDSLRFGLGSHVLAGANGSGKSSLLKAIAGLLHSSGEVTVGGRAAEEIPGRGVAYLPQDSHGLEHLSVLDAVRYAQHATRSPGSADEWVAAVDMTDRATRRIGSLSGGERRLAYLAMLLSQDVPVLLLDEPTAGLDASHRVALRRALRVAAQSRVVITASHVADDLDDLGDRVVVLSAGRVVFDGAGEQLVTSTPAGTWDAALMAVEGA